ncbi:adenosine deaminase domain-containing protein 1-like [Gigantopelta aegis]|uniref:adenosine deaminase domain-containing protein 1-like n=1 Tax=Gigantopelta aegis TaxID=1735272 RepID=UPI001B88DED8|nr:adenosine deaminase domain-containing protein 1-like [Gigantopelta aegis]
MSDQGFHHPAVSKAVENVQRSYEKKMTDAMGKKPKTTGPYIPGLTQRPENPSLTDPPPKQPAKPDEPKAVPPELIENFLSGKKHPISSLMEYASMMRHEVKFQEVGVEVYSFSAKFASMCIMDGMNYPQGVGKTKKEAKTNAAKIAFTIVLGLNQEEVEADESGTIQFDSMGRRLIIPKEGGSKPVGHSTIGMAVDVPFVNADPLSQDYNPVLLLQNFCTRCRIPFSITVGDDLGPYGYFAEVKVRSQKLVEVYGKTKKDAKRQAAEEALGILMETEHIEVDEMAQLSEPDRIATLAYNKLFTALEAVPDMYAVKKIFAAFIVKHTDTDHGEVIAFGTGHCSLSTDKITTDGRSLIDSTAITIAHRALLKYFHKEMKRYYEGGKVLSIFAPGSNNGVLQLKKTTTLHLYISEPPDGDYGLFADHPGSKPSGEDLEMIKQGAHFPSFEDDANGFLCIKDEDGLVMAVGENQKPLQTLTDLQGGEDLVVMSASDKLLQWNILGLQSAIFSHFLDPIYLSSVTVGSKFDHGHFCRAVCCRVYGVLQETLPPPYQINHPRLNPVSLKFAELYPDGPHPTSLCINWSDGDEQLEITDGFSGRAAPISPKKTGPSMASRLCKAAFLARYKELALLSEKKPLISAPTYYAAKQISKKYQAAKKAFRDHCIQAGIGCWVAKPSELDTFNK